MFKWFLKNYILDLEKFKEAVDHTSDHIIFTDPKGTILYANEAASQMTGFLVKEMIGKKAGTTDLWGGQMSKDFYRKMWQTIAVKKKHFTGEIVNRRKNGEKYIAQVHVSPILDGQGNIQFFVGIERDITKMKEIIRLETEFISTASHQLRTPLTGIKWVAERLLKVEKLSPRGQTYLQDIHRSVDRLSSLVDTLLNVSRLDGAKIIIEPKPLEAVAFINDYIKECKPLLAKKKLILNFKHSVRVLACKTDLSAFRNIVQSLLSNAIEYTNPAGQITVSLSTRAGSKKFLLAVKDTGIGIPKAEQAMIFEKFTRGSNAKLMKTDGTGLGLYIARESTKLLGGKIWFASIEGEGSIFYVQLPLQARAKRGEKGLT